LRLDFQIQSISSRRQQFNYYSKFLIAVGWYPVLFGDDAEWRFAWFPEWIEISSV